MDLLRTVSLIHIGKIFTVDILLFHINDCLLKKGIIFGSKEEEGEVFGKFFCFQMVNLDTKPKKL